MGARQKPRNILDNLEYFWAFAAVSHLEKKTCKIIDVKQFNGIPLMYFLTQIEKVIIPRHCEEVYSSCLDSVDGVAISTASIYFTRIPTAGAAGGGFV